MTSAREYTPEQYRALVRRIAETYVSDGYQLDVINEILKAVSVEPVGTSRIRHAVELSVTGTVTVVTEGLKSHADALERAELLIKSGLNSSHRWLRNVSLTTVPSGLISIDGPDSADFINPNSPASVDEIKAILRQQLLANVEGMGGRGDWCVDGIGRVFRALHLGDMPEVKVFVIKVPVTVVETEVYAWDSESAVQMYLNRLDEHNPYVYGHAHAVRRADIDLSALVAEPS